MEKFFDDWSGSFEYMCINETSAPPPLETPWDSIGDLLEICTLCLVVIEGRRVTVAMVHLYAGCAVLLHAKSPCLHWQLPRERHTLIAPPLPSITPSNRFITSSRTIELLSQHRSFNPLELTDHLGLIAKLSGSWWALPSPI